MGQVILRFLKPALALSVSLCCGSAIAGGMRVSPVSMALDSLDSVKTLRIGNSSGSDLVVQVEMFRWTQGDDSNTLDATREVIASPPIVEVAPNAQRTIRVGVRAIENAACETAFRLSATEIPKRGDDAAPVRLRTRVLIPVFVTQGRDCEAELKWTLANGRLSLRNHGNGHEKLRELVVITEAEEFPLPLKHLGYFLPGAAQHFDLPDGLSGNTFRIEARTADRRWTVAVQE